MSQEIVSYQKAGVNADKADQIISTFADYLKTRPRDRSLLSGIGPYASCYSLKFLLGQYTDPVLVTCCDGVGTKAKLALDWGDLSGLGQDLLAMNVNDLLCIGARPLLFLDYYACGNLQESQLLTLLKSIQTACEASGCSLAGGETAEMPGLYQGADFDLAGFAVGVVERDSILGPARVRDSDVVLALASSGVHSNGYSLVRKLIEREKIAPETTSPFGGTWREILLKPTRLYVPVLKSVISSIHALAHITGGGLLENLPRVLPAGATAEISSSAWKIPDLFQWLQAKSGISTQELLTTFNCGVGMIAIADNEGAPKIIQECRAQGVTCWEVGRVRIADGGAVPSVIWK